MIVLDTSAIVGLVFPDEDKTYPRAVLRELGRGGAIVPSLFWYEIRNVLLIGERRGRLHRADVTAFLRSLENFKIGTEPPEASVDALSRAREHRLTVYDAAYLDAAQRHGVPLATLDRELRSAAAAAGVSIFQP